MDELLLREALRLPLETEDVDLMLSSAMVLFSFCIPCRSGTVSDIGFDGSISVKLDHTSLQNHDTVAVVEADLLVFR